MSRLGQYIKRLQTQAITNATPLKTGEVDSNNSTSTPLNNGDTFTGTATLISGFSSITVACKTDQNGVLYVDLSTDGTNWDSILNYDVLASTNEVHRIGVTRGYFRVRFTNNSGSNQTYLRLSALKGQQTQLTSALNSVVQDDADAIITRPIDFNLMVAEGLYLDRNNTIKDGINFDIDTASVPEDITNEGGVYAGFPATAGAAEIVVAGADTGTVYYSYLESDTSTDYVFATKAVTGAGTYALGHNIWRCNFAYFVKNSTTLLNVGDITIRHTATPTNVFVVIPAGYSQSFCAAYTVPYNSSIYIDRFQGNLRGSSTGSLDGVFWYRSYGESPRYRFPFELQYGTLYFDDVDFLIKIPSRTDFIPRIITSSANNLVAKFSYRLIKVK